MFTDNSPQQQSGAHRMAQQPPTAQYYQGRAMRYWVSRPDMPLTRKQDITILCLSHEARANFTSSASAALCQVFDSIFLDIPMSRVKFNTNTEYAYIQNFKVLQSESLPLPPGRLCAANQHRPPSSLIQACTDNQ
jgi:hypothetical protein